MSATLWTQSDPGGSSNDDEPRVLVAGIVEGIEPALDKWIVERADRQQPLAEDRMRETERRQQREQIHLGDTKLDMLAGRREGPIVGRGNPFRLEQIDHLAAREQAAAIDPGAEIGRYRHVGRGGDDAAREIAFTFGDF